MKVQPKNQEDEIDKSYLLLLSSDVIQRLLTVFGFKLILQNNVSDIVPSFVIVERITIIIVLLFYLLVVFNKDIIYLYRIKLVSLISFVGSFISSYSMFPYFGAILFFMPISQLLWLVPFFVYKDKVKSSDILVLSIISSFIYITISIVTTLVVGVSWFTK